MEGSDAVLLGIVFVCSAILFFYTDPILTYFTTGIVTWRSTDWVIVWLVFFICVALILLVIML